MVLGGVSVSAIMTFFVVPAAFYLFERRRAEKDWAQRAQLGRDTRPAEARPPRSEGGYAPGS